MLPGNQDTPKAEPQALTMSGAAAVEVEIDFWELWKESEGFLLNLCLRWMRGNKQEAREMLSAGMMRAYERGGERLGLMGNPRAWLAQVVRSFIIDNYLAQKRSPAFSVDPEYLIFKMDEQWPGHELSPERNFLVDESYHYLQSVIEDLPDRLRSVMILRAYQNMPYKQIALHLQISPENARKRVQEAKALVQARLDQPDHVDWRGSRRADPSGSGPRSERRAADETLQRKAHAAPAPSTRWAEPVAVRFSDGRVIELPVFHHRQPRRLVQREESAVKYIERHPSGYKRREDHARLLHARGDWLAAIQEGKKVLERNPQRLMLRLDMAVWCETLNQSKCSQDLLEEGLAFTASKAWAAHLWARLLALRGMDTEARVHFNEACRLQPDEVRHRLAKIEFWWGRGDFQAICLEAKAWCQQKQADRQVFEWWRLALGKSEDWAALQVLDAEIETQFPGDPLVRARSMWKRMENGETVEKNEIRKLARNYPHSVLVLQLQIKRHLLRNEPAKVARLWEKAVLNCPAAMNLPLPHSPFSKKASTPPPLALSLWLDYGSVEGRGLD